jgi:type IX secretion system PorP/SprF family membrane protein
MMKVQLKSLLFLCIALSGISVSAQDHVYSQFFSSPIYLNPALNGQFEGDMRADLIYRNQWSAIPGKLTYLTASLDFNIPRFAGGLGIMFTRSNEGTAYLTKNNISGIYSYSVGDDDFVASFGLQAGLSNRKIDWNKLVFSDQIDPRLGYIHGSSSDAERPAFNSKYYFDAAAGLNFVYKNVMLGTALQHLNQPDESFTGSKSLLPVRAVLHASYRIPLGYYDDFDDEGYFLIPSVVIYHQAKVTSINSGFQFKRRSLKAGLWYRSSGESEPAALVVSLLFDLSFNKSGNERLQLGLSHDATTSKLNYSNTSGTSEFSLGYQKYFPNSFNEDKFDGIRCYDFY